jgi:hypothetical protein
MQHTGKLHHGSAVLLDLRAGSQCRACVPMRICISTTSSLCLQCLHSCASAVAGLSPVTPISAGPESIRTLPLAGVGSAASEPDRALTLTTCACTVRLLAEGPSATARQGTRELQDLPCLRGGRTTAVLTMCSILPDKQGTCMMDAHEAAHAHLLWMLLRCHPHLRPHSCCQAHASPNCAQPAGSLSLRSCHADSISYGLRQSPALATPAVLCDARAGPMRACCTALK